MLGLLAVQLISRYGGPAGATFLADWTAGWGKLPGFLINVVFACLFLGVTIPRVREIWRQAAPQLAYGQTVAWGQYVVGIGVTLLVLAPLFAMPDRLARPFGAVIPVGFEGGHGTAGGLQKTFDMLDISELKDIALASATVGVISAVVVGMALVNWAARRGWTHHERDPESIPEDEQVGIIPVDRRPSAGRLTIKSDAIETFTLHIAIVGFAILIGWGIKQGLTGLEWAIQGDLPWDQRKETVLYVVMHGFPLFPLCMIGGLIVQLLEQKFDRHQIVDVGISRRIQNTALDFLVVAAISLIRIETLKENWAPFALLCLAGILWNVFCVTVLARRMLPDAWFERSIAEMGQSMGVTATGILLLRVVDPDYETPAARAFAYKQIAHEPFMGGGLWTSAAIPLLAAWGGWPVFGIAAGACAVWFMLSAFVLNPRAKARAAG